MKRLGFFFVILFAAIGASAQKSVPSLPDTATLDETGKWLIQNFAKYASYKTSGREFEISKPKFAACKLSYTTITRFGSTDHDTMGATVRRSNSKSEAVIDLAGLDPAIKIADHLYPDLKYLRIAKLSSTVNPIELSVKDESAEAMRSALSRAITLCNQTKIER